ncbi:RNA 2',3'-cyclic phosphodiesterase [Streptomyces sp. DSM 42041]|uniref:RNA 2',3'-cyclic phosphodiesterase n=1 Tax=Streptomyces hazeniae TaxID=3075538 RepID=A0ABU2NNS9_9ACTN|nr:RNA 2',3'-cyclic phosphodiesterase [Streptomyces sp. DSM 42041]MDT0378430.1 RNA 2',3'-cyclic phosphodiesterase [Streptomyces sp. DSM 42041]
MRLFAALLPPDPAVAALAGAVAPLHGLPGADRLRWTHREGWHFTLAFYGEVDAAHTLPDLRERLARAARRSSPLQLRLSGAGRFGDRALWVGADGDRRALERLAQAAQAAGRRSGVQSEAGRPFRAHLTLARSRGRARGPSDGAATDLRPYVEALGGFESDPWTAPELTLVHSRLPASGVPGEQPHYAPIAAWPLGG